MNDLTNTPPASKEPVHVRQQKVAAALTETARSLTFGDRSRRAMYQIAGLRPRRRDQVFLYLLWAAFLFCFLLPVLTASGYLFFVVSDQYVSETRFVLRSSVSALSRNRLSEDSTKPSTKIRQDTQVVTNFIESPAMIEALGEKHNLRQLFGRGEIDFWSRLENDASREDRLKYWHNHISSWTNPQSGIVTLEIAAFSPNDAKTILETVMVLAEERVNKLNSGIWAGLLEAAEEDVKSAKDALEKIRITFNQQQDRSGIFDIEQSASGIGEIIREIKQEILSIESERTVLLQSLNEDTPSIRNLDRQIDARQKQVEKLETQLAGQQANQRSFANEQKEFSKLQLDRQLAEDRFTNSIEELERVKLLGTLQLVYLDQFLSPTLPEDNTYPRRFLWLSLSIFIALMMWGLATYAILTIQSRLD